MGAASLVADSPCDSKYQKRKIGSNQTDGLSLSDFDSLHGSTGEYKKSSDYIPKVPFVRPINRIKMKLVTNNLIHLIQFHFSLVNFHFYLQFIVAALLAVAVAAPSGYESTHRDSSYMTSPSYGSSGYNKDSRYGGITITSQHDVRNLDGSSKWG
jgi:hypothetical protein